MIIPVGYAQVNFVFTGQAAPEGAEVTLGLDVSNQSLSDQAYADAIRDAWVTNMLPQQTAQISLSETRVKYGPTATGRTVISPGGGAGGVVGESEVPNVSVLIHKLTAFGGRAGRGRMYVPGFNTVLFDSGGVMSGGNQVGLQSAVDAFGADLATSLAEPVLLHGADSPLTTPSVITGFAVQAKAATQRRRLRR